MKTFMIMMTALVLTGCSNAGLFMSAHSTEVHLAQGNYQIIAANVNGESSAAYVIGLSYGIGAGASSLALLRVSGTGMLYKEALENLWKNFEEQHGPVSGRELALTNVRYDADMINTVLYTRLKIAVRADVIEFKK